ncbi:hypothetical protein D3C81_1147800 [compost metagenome]
MLLAELVVGEPGRRDVRRIGLEHDGLERQFRREPADLSGAGEGQVAAETELHAVLDVAARLLVTAVEGVCNALPHAHAAQLRIDLILRLAYMQQHRKIEIARDLHLLGVEPRLVGGVQPRDEEVEADFADGDEARVVHRRSHLASQFVQIRLPGAGCTEGMDAERVDAEGAAARLGAGMRQRAHGTEVGHRHGRQYDARDAGLGRRARDVRAIAIELAGVEVAVGIDPHGGAGAAGRLG